MTDATHTRESELREILAEEIDRRETLHETAHDKASPLDRCFDAAMAAMRRISTPIPLTPSDEMVEAAIAAFYSSPHVADPGPYYDPARAGIRNAIQAALNLMGGKK